MDKQSLEELESSNWGEAEFASSLVLASHRLRKKPIGGLTVDELRLLIGQRIGLPYLLPRALAVLEDDPLTEGDYFPGDLLVTLLRLDPPDLHGAGDALTRLLDIARRAAETATDDEDLRRELLVFLERESP